jgi:VWFA-related protein
MNASPNPSPNPSRPLILLLACIVASLSSIAAQQSVPSTHGELIHRTPEQQTSAKKRERRLTFKVIVKDGNGSPATGGLQQSDFSITDNGRPQPVISFTAVDVHTQPADRVILLIDTSNNTFDNVAFERKGITEYLRLNNSHLAHPTSLVIFSDYGVQVGKPSLDGKVLINDLRKVSTQIRENAGAEGGEGVLRRFQSSIRALTKLVTYEATIPGHSTVIWFGPGWPLLASARVSISTDRDRRGYFSAIVDLTNRLREAGITLDDIAPSALIAGSEQRQDFYKVYLRPVLSQREADAGHLALPVLSIHSGGQYLQQGQTLPQEIAACVADADNYYLLTIASPATPPDTYHVINVMTADTKLTVHTNAGYYSEP